MRVILDRSALHGERFAVLESSPLRRLIARNQVVLIHTPILIEEIISEYGTNQASDAAWRSHLEFAADSCNGGFFLSRPQIWYNEIVQGRGPFARSILPERKSRRYQRTRSDMVEHLKYLAATGDLAAAWQESTDERDDTYRKKENQRSIFRDVRVDTAKALRQQRLTRTQAQLPFSTYLKSEFHRHGRLLMDQVHPNRPEYFADLWAASPQRFPYYSGFVEGFIYSLYYAALEQSAPLDRNAQADYEQLAYLVWADVIVSNDTRFLRRAFDALWRPRGKLLKTAEEFTEFLHAIV